MKKTLIALAAVAVSSAAMAQVTVYGVVDVGYGWSEATSAAGKNTADTAGLVSGTMSGSRFGFRGVEELDGGMKAGFQLEAGIDATGGALLSNGTAGPGFGRVAQAYFEGGFGRVALGRHLLPSYLASSAFDPTGASTNHEVNDLTVNGARGDGVWYAKAFGPVAVSAFVSSGKAGSDTAANKRNGYDISARYSAGPLVVALATTSDTIKRAAIAEVAATPGSAGVKAAAASNTEVTGAVFGLSYDLGMAKLMVNSVVQDTKNKFANTKTQKSEVNYGVNVPMGKATLMAGIGLDEDTDAKKVKSKSTDYTIGASYAMSKRTNVFAFTSMDEAPAASGAKNAETTYTTVGVRHTF